MQMHTTALTRFVLCVCLHYSFHAFSLDVNNNPLDRYAIFYDLKMELLEAALRQTGSSGSQQARFELRLDHGKATLSEDCGQRSALTSQCVFAQAFQQCVRHEQSHAATWAASLRAHEGGSGGGGGKVFSVSFVGESGIDVGGVYREALTEMVLDLHLPDHKIDLFKLCPNGEHKINSNMDKIVPRASSTSPLAISMFEFVGKLMGLSLRTKATLPFCFPSLVWKGVVGSALDESDLDAIDTTLCQVGERKRERDKGSSNRRKKKAVVFAAVSESRLDTGVMLQRLPL